MLDLKRVLAAVPKEAGDEAPRKLTTVWGDEVAREAAEALARGDAKAATKSFVPRAEHPHPQFARVDGHWECLNGWWECAFARCAYDPKADVQELLEGAVPPEDEDWRPILVPFSPEADLSGVGQQLKPGEVLWYRRTFAAPALPEGERLLLHFEAVDDTCAVWVNDHLLGTHQGGYLPFAFDITEALADAPDGTCVLEVCVADPSDEGVQLRGKQRLARGNIWYTAQSGIWQPVWLERVPAVRILGLALDPDARSGVLSVEVETSGEGAVEVKVIEKGFPVASANAQVVATKAAAAEADADEDDEPSFNAETAGQPLKTTLTLTFAEVELWSPEHPFLYNLEVQFAGADCPIPDAVRSYFAFRTCNTAPCTDADDATHTRFWLNDHPFFLRGVLNQGYWPDGLMTAPSDAALIADIVAMRDAGFTMLREHIKVEADRFYYHCDRLGMLVWQDMVSGGSPAKPLRTMYLPTLFTAGWTRYSDTTPTHWISLGAQSPRYRKLWREGCEGTVRYLRNHPCIVTWVLFNEGWGQFAGEAMCGAVRALDRTRPIQAVSGWYDNGAGDYFGVHNYFRPQQVWRDRFAGKRPKGTCVKRGSRACVTDEFGGIVCNVEGHAQHARSFGYDVRETRAEYAAAVRRLLAEMDALEARGLAGYVYTQVSDVEEETNGILTYDRRVNKLG